MKEMLKKSGFEISAKLYKKSKQFHYRNNDKQK